ncbi:MAG: GDP-mannose 4,6-dehydratase, partial [Planctomycetes bacterium]|nr:GDP-mannose 4,6-dehydratase [Planctomycetota bacterium]
MSHCLVTGGAGFIGSHLCEQLIQQGEQVTAVDDLSTGFLQNLDSIIDHPQFTFRTGSIT